MDGSTDAGRLQAMPFGQQARGRPIFTALFVVIAVAVVAVATADRAAASFDVTMNRLTGAPSFLRGSIPVHGPGDARARALAAVERQSEPLGIRRPRAELDHGVMSVDGLGMRHVKFRQMYHGIPVETALLTVHLRADATKVVAISNGFVPGISLPTVRPRVNLEHAVSLALAQLPAGQPIGRPRLVVYPGGAPERSGERAVLAWVVKLADWTELSLASYVIDASTGDLVDVIDHAHDSRDRLTYDANHGAGIPSSLPGELERTEDDPPTGNADVDWAHDFAGETYDYFADTHGRDGYDGRGTTMRSTTHFGTGFGNAFWWAAGTDNEQTVFGDEMATRDVVAHEWTHAVTLYTADLSYAWQSGALSESFSDIFGAMVDRDDWSIGEDSALGVIRSLADPAAYGQPDHVDDWLTTCGDNYGVHTNSGITNKAFYNIATALGRERAERIFYRALTVYLFPSSSLEDARAAAIQAAVDLYGEGSPERAEVISRFGAVGLDGTWQAPRLVCGGVGIESGRCESDDSLLGGSGMPLGWLEPTCLSRATSSVGAPVVQLGAQGQAFAAWPGWDQPTRRIRYAYHQGGVWSEPTTLTSARSLAQNPRIAESGSGSVLVSWEELWLPNWQVRVAEVSPGGQASPAVAVSPPDTSAYASHLTAAGDYAVAAWLQNESGAPIEVPQQALYTSVKSGAHWEPAEMLSEPGASVSTGTRAVAVNEAGDAIAVWREYSGFTLRIRASARSSSGNWSEPAETLASGDALASHIVDYPTVALDGQGNAMVAWGELSEGAWRLRAALRQGDAAPDAGWSDPVDHPYATDAIYGPKIALDGNGGGLIAWASGETDGWHIMATSITDGELWGETVDLGAVGRPQDLPTPDVAVNGHDDEIVVWSRATNPIATVFDVHAATRSAPTEGAPDDWQESVILAADQPLSPTPRVSLDPAGDALVVWRSGLPEFSTIRSAVHDVAGPELHDVSAPPSADVRSQVTFSVTARDTWSQIDEVTWSFGDGQVATGSSVAHSYSEPGTYSVDLAATDELGNKTTASETIEITAVPEPPPPLAPPPAPVLAPPPALVSADTTKPRIKRFKLTDKRISRKLLRIRGKRAVKIAYTLTEKAMVNFKIQKRLSKRKRVKRQARCEKILSRERRSKCEKKAKRSYKTVASFTRQAKKGINRSTMPKEIAKKLKTGSYRIEAQATDAVDNASRKKAVRFEVVEKEKK